MANWVCNKCTARMPVGAQWCPEPSCGATDAHEEGGDPAVNVFEHPPEATAMEGFIAGQSAKAEHVAAHAGLEVALHAVAGQFEAQIAATVEDHTSLVKGDGVERVGVEAQPGKTYELAAEGGEITELPPPEPDVEQLKRLAEKARRDPAPVSDTEGGAEVAERLGLVPGDPGAPDASTDPEPVGVEVFEESGGDTSGKSTSKTRQKPVPS